jgi:hypothetical protein
MWSSWNESSFLFHNVRELQIEPLTTERIDRLIRSAIHTYENQFFIKGHYIFYMINM